MAESAGNSKRSSNVEEEDDDDYMGDLTQFISPEACGPPKPSAKKVSNYISLTINPAKKKSKMLNWQEHRKLNREQRQIQEDEQTIASMSAPIPQSNIGFKLLKQMGYTPGLTLGKEGSGQVEPVGLEIRRSRAGIGRDDPHKEKKKRVEIEAERKKQKVEELLVEFGSRQKSQWRSKRVVINYKKANASLDQLENKEVIIPEKKEGDDEGEQEEEEEEITEEDLEGILMKLRNEHQYCLFCGCKYESMDALLSSCPGIDEDDH